MNFQQCEAFIKTVEQGSVTKAAACLGYTQSGVSHMLNALEAETGLTLLLRDRSGVRLTSEGQELLPCFRQLCQSQRALADKVAGLQGLESGLIRIGTVTSVSVQWLPFIFKEFSADHPDIRFELLYGGENQELEEWISQGRVDMAFLSLPTRRCLTTRFLRRDRILAVLPPGHPLAGAERLSGEELARWPFVEMDEGNDYELSAVFDSRGLLPDVRFTAWDNTTVMTMVANGLGISILPELVVQNSPFPLVCKELDPPAYRDLAVAYKTEPALSPAAELFLRYVEKWLEQAYQ